MNKAKEPTKNVVDKKEVKYLSNLSTQEMYEQGIYKNLLMDMLYGKGRDNDTYEKRRIIFKTAYNQKAVSENDWAKQLKIPLYILKRLMEEYGMQGYIRPSKLVSRIYRESNYPVDDENKIIIRGFALQEILEECESIEEVTEKYSVDVDTIYKYGIIFMVDIDGLFNLGLKDQLYEKHKLYFKKKYEPIKKDMEEKEMNEENEVKIEEKKEETNQTAETIENGYTEDQKRNYENIKKLDVIIAEIFSSDYQVTNNFSAHLEFEREYKHFKFKLKKNYPELESYFTRKRFENFLNRNFSKNLEKDELENIVSLKGIVNILSLFRKFESKQFVENEDGLTLEEVVKKFVSYSNILDLEKTMKVCSSFYVGEQVFNKKSPREDLSEDDLKSYVGKYLRLWDRSLDEKDTEDEGLSNKEESVVTEKTKKKIHISKSSKSSPTTDSGKRAYRIASKEDIARLVSTLEVLLDTGSSFSFVVEG